MGHGFHPWWGTTIPHAAEQLSLCGATRVCALQWKIHRVATETRQGQKQDQQSLLPWRQTNACPSIQSTPASKHCPPLKPGGSELVSAKVAEDDMEHPSPPDTIPNTRCLHAAQLDSLQPLITRKEGIGQHRNTFLSLGNLLGERSTTHALRFCPNKHGFFAENQTWESQPALYHHKGTPAPSPGAVSSATGGAKSWFLCRGGRGPNPLRITQRAWYSDPAYLAQP